eukprot:366370-Chlamydomonas_euryale.AAC.4
MKGVYRPAATTCQVEASTWPLWGSCSKLPGGCRAATCRANAAAPRLISVTTSPASKACCLPLPGHPGSNAGQTTTLGDRWLAALAPAAAV